MKNFLESEGLFLQVRNCIIKNGHITKIDVYPFYDQGRFSLQATPNNVHFQGNYLQILVGWKESSENGRVDELIEKTAARIQLLLGSGAALREVDRVDINVVTQSVSSRGNSEFLWGPFTGNDHSSFPQELLLLDKNSRLTLREKSLRLISTAIQSPDLERKFLFLWIGLEAQLGDGKARRRFFENEIGSTSISKETLRLAKVRDKVVHHADFELTKSEIVRLLEVIRIAGLTEGMMRKHLIKSLESDLAAQATM